MPGKSHQSHAVRLAEAASEPQSRTVARPKECDRATFQSHGVRLQCDWIRQALIKQRLNKSHGVRLTCDFGVASARFGQTPMRLLSRGHGVSESQSRIVATPRGCDCATFSRIRCDNRATRSRKPASIKGLWSRMACDWRATLVSHRPPQNRTLCDWLSEGGER